jgi:hypothetical protein
MKSLEEFLSGKREVTIHTLANYIKQYIHERCQPLLEENQEELLRVFEQAGENAYGVFSRMLCKPIQEQLTQAGFVCEPDYPGDFRTSSVETREGTPVGTLVTQFFHDHIRFRIPLPPGIQTLEETEPEAILAALSHASARTMDRLQASITQQRWVPQERPRWEYSAEIGLADTIDSKHIDLSETMLDNALFLWGRNGWELVSVVPHQGRLIAFFKRPAPAD